MDQNETHPLTAWRETQKVALPDGAGLVPLSIQLAAQRFGVPYQTWWAWEQFPNQTGHKMPSTDNMARLHKFTDGAIRPDHMHGLAVFSPPTAAHATLGAATLGQRGRKPALAGLSEKAA